MDAEDYNYTEFYRTTWMPFREPVLERLERNMGNRDDTIPMILGPEAARNVYFLARACRTERILELGTGLGYTTIWLAKAAKQFGGKVLTVEKREHLAKEALQNFRDAQLTDWIELRVAHAQQVLPTLTRPFDLVFLDAWKGEYVELLQPCVDTLREDGVLIAARASWAMLKEYLSSACKHPQLDTVIWPGSEGLIVSLKTEKRR